MDWRKRPRREDDFDVIFLTLFAIFIVVGSMLA